jgi:hypothetical protein
MVRGPSNGPFGSRLSPTEIGSYYNGMLQKYSNIL